MSKEGYFKSLFLTVIILLCMILLLNTVEAGNTLSTTYYFNQSQFHYSATTHNKVIQLPLNKVVFEAAN